MLLFYRRRPPKAIVSLPSETGRHESGCCRASNCKHPVLLFLLATVSARHPLFDTLLVDRLSTSCTSSRLLLLARHVITCVFKCTTRHHACCPTVHVRHVIITRAAVCRSENTQKRSAGSSGGTKLTGQCGGAGYIITPPSQYICIHLVHVHVHFIGIRRYARRSYARVEFARRL